jgi:hypothetical protein
MIEKTGRFEVEQIHFMNTLDIIAEKKRKLFRHSDKKKRDGDAKI